MLLAQSEIKAHPFFTGLDWSKVVNRRYRHEFKPPTNGLVLVASSGEATADGSGAHVAGGGVGSLRAVVSNFEDEFTNEPAVLDSPAVGQFIGDKDAGGVQRPGSLPPGSSIIITASAVERAHFAGFTYTGAESGALAQSYGLAGSSLVSN